MNDKSDNKKVKLVRISKDILFSEEVHGIIICGQKEELPPVLYKFLECLIDSRGSIVSSDKLIACVWGNDYKGYNDRQYIKDTLKRLRTKLGDTKRTIIVTHKGVGYSINAEEFNKVGCSIMLTNTIVANATEDDVLFRNEDYENIYALLRQKKSKAVLMYGFGGVGKTSLARLIYSNMKDEYDCFGWIDYHIDLKTSIVNCVDIDDNDNIKYEGNIEQQWRHISYILKNNNSKKLMVIDNVDFDEENGQDPLHDRVLSEISGWANMDIILTSRIPSISGYVPYEVKSLGTADDYSDCVDLFYYFNSFAGEDRDKNNEFVSKIVKLAGYNTMVIELLAKSSRYEESIEGFMNQLIQGGFDYPDVLVTTSHEESADITINQLKRLFELRKRNNTERLIIMTFRQFLETEKVSKEELRNWLGFNIEEIDSLVNEGWITFNGGAFSIHPLVRQSIEMDHNKTVEYLSEMNKFRDSHTERSFLIKSLERKELLSDKDSFGLKLRKLHFANVLSASGYGLTADVLVYLGDLSRKLGNRNLAVKYYNKAYEKLYDIVSGSTSGEGIIDQMNLTWEASYFYGYMLSYTKKGMDDAKKYISESLKIALWLDKNENSDASKAKLASSHDHLGYIIFNNNDDMDSLAKAAEYVNNAISLRTELCDNDPISLKYNHDLAWTYDNMGCLLTKVEMVMKENVGSMRGNIINTYDSAEIYLLAALKAREELMRSSYDGVRTEVAWTYCNLGAYVGLKNVNKAELYFRKALEIYDAIEEKYPGLDTSGLARTYSMYAKILSSDSSRVDDAIEMYNRALDINNIFAADDKDDFMKENDSIKSEINRLIRKSGIYSV